MTISHFASVLAFLRRSSQVGFFSCQVVFVANGMATEQALALMCTFSL